LVRRSIRRRSRETARIAPSEAFYTTGALSAAVPGPVEYSLGRGHWITCHKVTPTIAMAGPTNRIYDFVSEPRRGYAMKSVANILKAKADQTVYTIGPTASVLDAVKLMAEKNIGALVVMEGENVVGIITERDYARKIVLMARSSKDTPVRDIMTSSAMYVSLVQRSEECMALMTENRVRHLLVIDSGKLIGLVSIGDLVKGIISEQQFIIQQLEHYITGERS
jgi:CBS domain-containing protein